MLKYLPLCLYAPQLISRIMIRPLIILLLIVGLASSILGETVNIILYSEQIPCADIHIPGFENLTGHKVNLVPFDTKEDVINQIMSDLKKGSPFYDAFIFPGQLKSKLILCSECNSDQIPLIAPLTERIRQDPDLEWNDVALFQREVNSAYDGEIYTVPIDGDFHFMFYRKDILDEYGLNVPETWEDFISVGQQLEGKDLNNDGVPDYGACVERLNQTGWTPNGYYFWTIASPLIQSKGTAQGMFFDIDTFEIMANTSAFREAAILYKQISQLGPEIKHDDVVDAFAQGRCALAIDWANIASRSQLNTSRVANVTGMALAPGSRRVYNRATKQMESCTTDLCPFMNNGVNRAPFSATLGWTTAISRFISDSRREAAYSFLSYVSQPEHYIQSVLEGRGWDLVRDSLMNPQVYIDHGFSNETAYTFTASSKEANNHLNAVVDLPLEKFSDFYQSLGNNLVLYVHDQITLDELQSNTVQTWDSILNASGRNDQWVYYALFIGAKKPTFDYEVTLPFALRYAFVGVSALCILIAIGLVVFIVVYRNNKLIRGTSPTYHYTTLSGAGFIFLSILLFSLPSTTALCETSMWLFALGFGLIYGSIFAKLYRLWRLSTRSLVIKKITDTHLLPFFLGIIGVYVTLMTVWSVLDPPVSAPFTQDLAEYQYMMVCQTGNTGRIMFILVIAWSVTLLFTGIILSFLTRNLAEVYNESRPVSLSVYIYSLAAVILVPILFTVNNALVVFILTDAVLVFSTLVTLIALYLGKIIKIRKGVGNKVSSDGSTHSGTHHSSVRTSTNPSQNLEAEVKLLRARIADLELQLRSRPQF